jgi:hypothetical protein
VAQIALWGSGYGCRWGPQESVGVMRAALHACACWSAWVHLWMVRGINIDRRQGAASLAAKDSNGRPHWETWTTPSPITPPIHTQLEALDAPRPKRTPGRTPPKTLGPSRRAWRTLTCEEHWLQGGLPVAISSSVQPTLQMSAATPWPCCRMTSGAWRDDVIIHVCIHDFCHGRDGHA